VRTDELIRTLAADAPVYRPMRLAPLLAGGALAGAALWAVLIAIGPLHWPPARLAGASWFPMKAGYSFALAITGLAATTQLARPGGRVGWAIWIASAAFVVVAVLAMHETMTTPVAGLRRLWMGQTAVLCPWIILVAAAPTFVVSFWLLGHTAPTRLALAGAVAGFFAGGAGATTWSLYCAESTAAFVLAWYTLGVAACAGLGALIGPRLLRW
jgi:hypothetical protein